MVDEQWQHREKDLLNLLDQAQVRKSRECTDARDSEETGLAYVMKEVEDLRETVMRLSLEKETLLRQQSVANGSCSHAREEGSRAFDMIENRNEHAGKVVVNEIPTAMFGGADNVEGDVPLGMRSGGRGTEPGHKEMAQGCFFDNARTAADDKRTGKEVEGGGGIADKQSQHVDKEDKHHRYYRRCRRPRSGKGVYFSEIESVTGDKCHPDRKEDGESQAGTENRCWKGGIGVNATPTRAEDEEQLAPRNGPAPVPSLLTPRHPRARLVAAPSVLRF